ncbi:MAG: nitroreductase family protein, partial [Candidatus Bathyarchaeota archaeon]|nr:nitroreductase family protein [Candidatus Bathyarchaeota archaeon]
MKTNSVIECLFDHRSIRRFTDEDPTDEVVETVVRAGQRAPFSSQTYSLLLSRDRERNPWRAPLSFTVCVDSHKFEL